MRSSPQDQVWLNGGRHNIVYLFDTVSGRAQRFKAASNQKTAGLGQRCGRDFVGVFVEAKRSGLILQVGREQYPLDGNTLTVSRVQLAGLQSMLTITRKGRESRIVKQRTLARGILSRIDPGYDALDESFDDFLADISDIATSSSRRQRLLEVKDPLAGPWDLVDSLE